MLVSLRVVRASVWLSSLTRARQDGVLALVRTATASQVAYGAPEDMATATGSKKKRWAMVPIRYNETQAKRPVDVEIPDHEDATSPPRTGASVEIVLFVLFADSDRQSSKPRISWVARTTLPLSAGDLTAVDGAREVLFKSPLDGDVGTVEIAVQRADAISTSKSPMADRGEGGSFSVHWTSSEALDRDRAEQERARVDAECKLLERLAAAEANALRTRTLRAHALEIVRRTRAANAIQSAFKASKRRQRERQRQLRRQEEEAERLRKQALRAKITARNQRRTQRLIEQWTTTETKREELHARDKPPAELGVWMDTQRDATQAKLAAKLSQLEREREAKLRAIPYRDEEGDRDCVEDKYSPAQLLGDGLVHAIQRLHLRK